jgi:hypothetical protein
MVWSHYVEETNDPMEEYYDDGTSMEMDFVPPPLTMNIEDWTEWYSRDLMNMWFSLVQYREDTGLSNYVLPFASYTKFCEFCYANSDGTRNSYPS